MGAGLLTAFVMHAAAQAQPAGWNYYSGYTSLPTIPFAHGAMTPDRTASVFFNLNGTVSPFTLDTGSTGIAATSGFYTPGPKDVALGPGQVSYSSSNNFFTGTWYLTNVGIMQTAQVSNTNPVAGAQIATSQNVAVLAVTQSCNANSVPQCSPAKPFDLAYAGIGYNRNAVTVPPPAGTTINAFTNITPLAAGTSPGTYRQGYVIGASGITLGLSTAATQNFGVIKLLPDTAKATPQGTPWSTAPMTVMVNNQTANSGGVLLPDTGINYMFLQPGPNNKFDTTSCNGSNFCAVTGTKIEVWLPGQTGSAAAFTYVAPDPKGNPAPAGRVENDTASTTPFINTGRQFYQNFTYFYDDVGGYVGYTTVPGGPWAVATFSPVLSLNGAVPLPNGFQETMPVFLAGSTQLQSSGGAAFNSSIMGSNNSLSLSGGGAFAFNAPVALGSGAFSLQQGAASINAGLSAASLSVSQQSALNNSPGSTITAIVSNAGALNNSGTIVGNVSNAGALAGSGTISGNVVNAGAHTPGNSIGTMTIVGNYTNTAGGTYVAEVGNSGQSDRINVVGPATLQGGSVNVVAVPGTNLAARTTYTVLNATAGVTGTYASVNVLYPFLLSSLGYDANNVYLTLLPGGFAAAAQTQAQYAVGRVLDANVNTTDSDFATIIGTLATLPSSQVLPVMTAISGQNYSTFSSTMVQGAYLFLNNFANQTGGGSPASNRVALAEACDIACDVTAPAIWGAWAGALGGLGTIGSGATTGAVTYNAGGFAAGLDRMVAPGLRLGVTTGYTTGTQWTSGFQGNGTTDTFLAGLYGNYRMDKVYADAVFGYAYSYNQMWRQIFIPGLQPRTAQGRTGANQWYGQIEGGYRFDIGPVGAAMADAYITPFLRWQGYTGAQNGFTETGAQSLNLTVAGQTTNSLRSVLGAQLGGSIDLGWREKLALQLRLGWSHEYASTARPVTATIAGAPLMPFTTYGVAPTRDGAVVGFSANTAIADGASMYLRYEGNISGSDSAHALTAGVRMSW
jgi:uncharacterized protein with beta-barrel porin domain